MNKINKLIVYNHDYQLKNFDNFNCQLLKIDKIFDNKYSFPLLETINFLAIPICRIIFTTKIYHIIMKFEQVIIYGCQDYLSWYIYRLCKKKNIIVKVIPDNIEFFLRPRENVSYKFNIIKLYKIISFGLYKYRINHDYGFFLNRLIFSVDKKNIDFKMSFFYNKLLQKKAVKISNSNTFVFISQPYYIDYKIDLNNWTKLLSTFLSKIKKKGFNIYIKYHQRDSLKFKESLSKEGFLKFENTNTDIMYIGLFSTYLFELALQGNSVFSCFNQFKFLFPKEYTQFVYDVSSTFSVDLNHKTKWNLKNYQILDILNFIYK